MELTKVSLWNVSALGTSEYGFGRVTAVTGRAGSGKTTLLAAIDRAREAIAPQGTGRADLGRFVAAGELGAKIVLAFRFDAQEQARYGIDAVSDAEVLAAPFGAPVIDAPGELRSALRWFGTDGAQGLFDAIPGERSLSSAYGTFQLDRYRALGATGDEAKLTWIEGYVCDLAMETANEGAQDKRRALNDRLQRSSPWLHVTGAARPDGGGVHLPVIRTAAGHQLGLRRLSPGERQLVMFAALLTALGPRRSILVVDDLERDLDPESQVALLSMLTEGDNQVIFSTRSETLRRASEVTTHIHLGANARRA